MSLLTHSPFTPARPTTLTQSVAQARHPRNHATAQLEPHREELLRLRQTGESVESLAGGLRLMGIAIGHETLRRWLQRELGQKPTRRKKPQRQSPAPASIADPATAATSVADAPNSTAAAAVADPSPKVPAPSGGNEPVMEGTALIRPGETPADAFRRRLAALDAEMAKAGSAQYGPPLAQDQE